MLLKERFVDAATCGDLEEVKRLYVNGLCENYEDAICWAARNGHLLVVKYLHENGAKRNYPIRWAARNGHHDVVVWLYERGANLELIKDKKIYSAIKTEEQCVAYERILKSLREENAMLKKKCDGLKMQLKYRPGGLGFMDAKKSFELSLDKI